MTLQSSGTISISNIKTELGSASNSLRTLSSTAGKSTPDAMSEFYGYSHSSYATTNLIYNLDLFNSSSYPGSGTTITSINTPTAFTATVNNGAVYTSGAGGNYFTYDGVNDYTKTPETYPYTIINNFTNQASFDIVFRRRGSGRTIFAYTAEYNGSYKTMSIEYLGTDSGFPTWANIRILFVNNSLAASILVGPDATRNVWYHVVGTWDGTTTKLYVNGSLYTSGTLSGTINNRTSGGSSYYDNINLGRKNNYAGEYANVDIGSFRIYNRALTAAEVTANYNYTTSKYPFAV